MTTNEYIDIFSDALSIVIASIAIWLAIWFYNKSKNTEKETSNSLIEIKTQINFLKTVTNNLIDYITKQKDDFILKLLKSGTIQKPDNISKFMSEENINIDVKKSYINYMIKNCGDTYSIIETLYYKIKNELDCEIDFKNQTVKKLIKNEISGQSSLDHFFDIFFHLHSNNIITILSIDPFKFQIK